MTDQLNRRSLVTLGTTALSAAGIMALAGTASPAFAKTAAKPSGNAQDAGLLNAAIGLEHEGIAAYEIALGSGLIPQAAVGLVRSFQGHHKQHRDELAKAVIRLGGKPTEAKKLDEYVKSLNAASITKLEDIQRLALRLERGAASAYIGLIAGLKNTEYHTLVAQLAADEALHATVFMLDLKEEIPSMAHIFS